MDSRLFSYKALPNPFDSKEMAKHYDRPADLYARYINHVVTMLNLKLPIECALDVACGKGVSTRALKSVAKKIIGVDASEEMLPRDRKNANIEYKHASAESLPFLDSSFNLVSICVAFHCVNQSVFLKEAARVLRDDGHLIIFHTKFKGIETPQFQYWFNNIFYKKYPLSPGRREYSPVYNQSPDFIFGREKKYSESIEMNIEELSNLLMTTSGVFIAVEKNKEKYTEIEKWLRNELKQFIRETERVLFRMDMSIWCLIRSPRLTLTESNVVQSRQILSKL